MSLSSEITARICGPDTRDLRQSEIDALTARGVTTDAIAFPDLLTPATVHFADDGRFLFRDELRGPAEMSAAYLIACRCEAGDLIDLAAWRPAEDALALWCKSAWCLGEDWLGEPYHVLRADMALSVFATPLAWLQADRRGVVIIDERMAARRLLDHGPFLAENVTHGIELRTALTIAPPVVRVPSISERTAA